jgi:hypothetical protein
MPPPYPTSIPAAFIPLKQTQRAHGSFRRIEFQYTPGDELDANRTLAFFPASITSCNFIIYTGGPMTLPSSALCRGILWDPNCWVTWYEYEHGFPGFNTFEVYPNQHYSHFITYHNTTHDPVTGVPSLVGAIPLTPPLAFASFPPL